METFAQKIRTLLDCDGHQLPKDADENINRIALASPLYAQLLTRNPKIALWLELSLNKEITFRYSAFKTVWESEFFERTLSEDALFERLRRFRRQLSLRIAYREVNRLSTLEESMHEHSLLADFCIQQVAEVLHLKFEQRFGTPWLESGNRPCSYVIFALGKLGGMELNFCSDVDLIYLYENEGVCVKNGKKTALDNQAYFQRFFQELTTTLQKQTPEGFLFNVDLRLRPEGGNSPIAKSIPFADNYYWSRGQTWERMALIKARPCCGSIPLGEELLESLNAYRYPRFVAPNIIDEVTCLKARVEAEALGPDKRLRDIKSGWGGIREIEYITQTLQLLNGGKTPFIQSRQTLEALERLYRYSLIPKEDAQSLQQAYIFLRSVENTLQMQEEKQTHTLPESDEEQANLAALFSKQDYSTFLNELNVHRTHVHTLYEKLLPQSGDNDKHSAWNAFLSSSEIPASIAEILKNQALEAEPIAETLRTLILGRTHNQVTEEQVRLAATLSQAFDSTFPLLASPAIALTRLEKLAERYGARTAFLKTCATTPKLFKTLCILLDRSVFMAETLNQHPEILEELLNTHATRIKTEKQIRQEIELLPEEDGSLRFLWLYVKAEQVRTAMCHALEAWNIEHVQKYLSTLARATLCHILKKRHLLQDVALIALGKLGGAELTYGSDLDLLILSTSTTSIDSAILGFKKSVEHKEHGHPIYTLDLRLRPYGNDGPITSNLKALEEYYKKHAQPWELLVLTRGHYIGGNAKLGKDFHALKESLLYAHSASQEILDSVWEMRTKIYDHKTNPEHPHLGLKATHGGLLDNEFLAQTLQLKLGYRYPELRNQNTQNTLNAALRLKILSQKDLLDNLDCFKKLLKIECALRQDTHTPQTQIPTDRAAQQKLARWIGLPPEQNFLDFYRKTLETNAETTQRLRQALKT